MASSNSNKRSATESIATLFKRQAKKTSVPGSPREQSSTSGVPPCVNYEWKEDEDTKLIAAQSSSESDEDADESICGASGVDQIQEPREHGK
jgi:hypothetical protein